MKLHSNETEQLILSSDDIAASGKNIGKVLTEIIDEHSTDINDLKKYTKWLYKYGGTGSKGGSGGGSSNSKLQYQIKLAGIIVQNSNDYYVLGDKIENDKNVPLNIILTNANVNNIYKLNSLIVNGNSLSINDRNFFNLDNNFNLKYSLNLSTKNKGNISIIITYNNASGDVMQESISINYIKDAYSFKTDIVNNNNESIFYNYNEGIIYSNMINSENGVNLKINYDLIEDNDIIIETTSNILDLAEQPFILNNIDKKDGYNIIPFNNEFINNEDLIGEYSITLSFYANVNLSYTRIYKETINFTVLPNDAVYIKVKPKLETAQIYKYNENNINNIVNIYNEYSKYYDLYVKLNKNKILSQSEVDDILNNFLNIEKNYENTPEFFEELLGELYNKLNDYQYYVYGAGNITFLLSPYMPRGIDETELYYQFGKYDESELCIKYNEPISKGIIKSSQKNKSFNINIVDSGIYVISFYVEGSPYKIKYYFYVYNKDNTFNWYRSNIEEQVFNNKNYLHYFRNGNVTPEFNQYQGNQYIQQYSSGTDINACDINVTELTGASHDCFCSIGIQYNYINKANSHKDSEKTPIISIRSDNNSSLSTDIYQDKILIDGNKITLFLPKENDYNVSDNSKYHLLSLYKRFIYRNNDTPYYEICVYLDGVLEGAMSSFSSSTSIWNKIILHNSNYSINLLELAYIPHDINNNDNYLDDIAISEYHYKFASMNNSLYSTSIDDVSNILTSLREFKETEYGMIEVNSADVINDISKSINIPIIVFEYNETKNNPNKFVSNFFPSVRQEGEKHRWYLNNLYYSPGKFELDIKNKNAGISLPGNDGRWYIELQGSSTMQYFVKNLTLGIECGSEHVYLFTPNFMYADDNSPNAAEAINTYLPERAFTLKADMVDSSHCNNTSIGKFVNNNTKKFDISFGDEHSVYHKYVKNCLTGFPILTFIKVNSYDETGNTQSNIYFLGIYNFNLGRDSYFNLGYINPLLLKTNNNGEIDNILKTCDGNKFTTMSFELNSMHDTELRTSDSVIVAEIQGNNSHYEFSQYSASMLLPTNDLDDDSMFGDFVPKLTPNSRPKILWHLQRLVEHVAKGGGYIFDYILKKHLGEHSWAYSRYIEDEERSSIFNSANQVPTYRLQFDRFPISGSDNEDKEKNSLYLISKNYSEEYIGNLITNNDQTYYNNLKTYLTDLIFEQEDPNEDKGIKEPILDYTSLAEYYTICMAFGLTDSVVKNLNVKTWNASWGDNYLTDENLHNVKGKWYVAFYDMDTAFGRYNDGSYLDNSYFSFSDYWLSDETKLSEISIYRDFFPKANSNDIYVKNQDLSIRGYDVPSSYLFAVAKYAALAFGKPGQDYIINNDGSSLNNDNNTFKMDVPQNLWTKFRVRKETITNTSSYYGLTGIGELCNAKYFVDNYFAKSMNNIPEQLWNMNYRFKYLKRIEKNTTKDPYHEYVQSINETGFISKELVSFHGRGIYELEDWLNHRLHMLDAYFNVYQSITPIKYLVYYKNNDEYHQHNENADLNYHYDFYNIIAVKDNNDNETIGYNWSDTALFKKNYSTMLPWWEETGYYDIIPVESENILKNNTDVVVLQDIFSAQNETRFEKVDLNVKAYEYSPLAIIPYAKINLKKHLLINPNVWYNIKVNQMSSDSVTLCGSGLWTDVENMNTLIARNSLNIYSDKIKNLIITSGTCNTWNISNMKSLSLIDISKSVDDTYSKFTGTIGIVESEDMINYPDLQKISLNRTNMSLDISGGNVSGLRYIYYENSTGNVSIINCNKLIDVKLTNSTITTCKILPGWTDKINISNTKIENLHISAKDTNADNNELEISNCSTLKTIHINGNFKKVKISKCYLLDEIYFDHPESIESLVIESCNNTSESTELNIYVNNTCKTELNEYNEYEINLNDFRKLKAISFYGTHGFNVININELKGYKYPTLNNNSYNVIELLSEAFNATHLKEIKTKIKDNSIVNDEDVYLLISDKNINDVKVNKTATFAGSYFNQDRKNRNEKTINNFLIPRYVSNLSALFRGLRERNAGITSEELASWILGNNDELDGKHFIYENKDSITDLSYMFEYQNITCKDAGVTKHLTLSKFKNVNNIIRIFKDNTNFTYADNSLFKLNGNELGSLVSNIDISWFSEASLINVNLLDGIINKLSSLSFSAYSSVEKLYETINNEKVEVGKTEPYKISRFFKDLNANNITKIEYFMNFNKSIKIDWENAFEKLTNVLSIKHSFNHKGMDSNDKPVSDIGISKSNLDNLLTNKLSELVNSLNITNFDDPIDYAILYNYYKTFFNRNIDDRLNILNLHSKCNINNLINYINGYNECVTDLSYAFRKLIVNVNENVSKYELNLSNADTTFNFKQMSHTFDSMQFEHIGEDNKVKLIPIIISQNTLKSFTKVINWSYAFSNITLYQNLPLNMFNHYKDNGGNYTPENYYNSNDEDHPAILSMEGMFENVKIIAPDLNYPETYFKHEDYEDICETTNGELKQTYNSILNGSYNKQFEVETREHFNNELSIGNPEQITKHLIVPFDIFYGCGKGCNIDNCFANSQFEGILPDNLLRNTQIELGTDINSLKFKNTFKNLLVIPNYVGKYKFNILGVDDSNSLVSRGRWIKNENGSYGWAPIAEENELINTILTSGNDYEDNNYTPRGAEIDVYAFIPEEFTNIKNLTEAFTFKILLPNSPQAKIGQKEAYAIFRYNSLGLTTNGEFISSIDGLTSLAKALPGQYQSLKFGYIDNSNNIQQFKPDSNFYNILYFIMLPNKEDFNTEFKYSIDGVIVSKNYNSYEILGFDRKDLGFKYINSITLKNTLENSSIKLNNKPVDAPIFNENLISILYGSILTHVTVEKDKTLIYSNFNINNILSPYSELNNHYPAIKLYSYDNNPYVSLSVNYSLLMPDLTTDNENYKYFISIINGSTINLSSRNTSSTTILENYRKLYKSTL